MKKITTFALIVLALFSGVLFSACGDKYEKLKMSVVYTDGAKIEELVLVKDEEKPELATKRIGVKFSGIEEEDIGQVAVYSSPSELFTTTNEKYSGNYYYIDITANKAATGELVVKHLSSDKTKKIKLRIEQKSNDLTATNKKYIIAVNGVAEGQTRVHTLNTTSLVSLHPSTSTDKIYFKEANGNTLPNGVKKVTEEIDGVSYVTGFEISNSTVEQADSYKLIPVTKMEGYEDKIYDDVSNNDCEIVEVYFKNVLNNSNVVLNTDEKHKTSEGEIYETIYLIANDVTPSQTEEYNYNNVIFTLETIGLGNISKYLDDYEISIIENSSAIQSTHIGNGKLVVQATAHTAEIVEVEFKLTPKNIVGDVETITKQIKVKGEVRSDTISATKSGEDVNINEIIDIYNYVAGGDSNGLKFKFKALSKSGIEVYSDLSKMRIEIVPEILYANISNGYYGNIIDERGNKISIAGANEFKQIDSGRYLSNQKNLIRIFKGNSYLQFQYDKDNQVFVSEPFMDFSDLYIKYVENSNVAAVDGISLQMNVTAGYEGDFKYLENISKTKITLNFDTKEGVKTLDLYASSYTYDNYGYVYDLVKDAGTGKEIVAENIYINKEDVIEGEKGYSLTLLKDNSIKGYEDRFLNSDVEFIVVISHSSEIKNPISLKDVNGKLTIDSLEKNIPIIVNQNTSVGQYVISFIQKDTQFRKDINCYIYEAFDKDKHLTLSFDEGELDNYAFKNSYFDEGIKKFTYSNYTADYIVNTGKTLNLTANVNQDVMDSNIIENYSYTATEETGNLIVNNHFGHLKDANNPQKSVLSFINGTVVKDGSGDYAQYYITYTIEITTKKFTNILQEDLENKNVHFDSLTFFIYEKISEGKNVKASLIHPEYNVFMSDFLGYNNKQYGQADVKVVMSDDIVNENGTITRGLLWNYIQCQEGESNLVKWKHNLGDDHNNVVGFSKHQQYSANVKFNKDGDKSYYSCTITAEIKQFNQIIELHWNVIVYRPNLTEEIRLTNTQPQFSKITSNKNYKNSIFEYNLDLQEGDVFTVTAEQISKFGEVSHKGLSLVVASAGGNVSDAVSVEGNSIKVERIQAGLRLIVYATDVLRADVSSYSSGFHQPEQYIIERAEEEYKHMYMNAYFIINLHLEDGESKGTAYSVYNLSDFEGLMNETTGKWYRIMNDINLTGLKEFNKNFDGNFYSANNQTYTLYDLKLNSEHKNLFKTFTGTMENITFETEFSYTNETIAGNLGIIGELTSSSILKYVNTVVSGTIELNAASVYNFGLIAGVNNGEIAYYESYDETNHKYIGKLSTAVSGRLTLKGQSVLKFGGIVGVNNGEIVGVNYNENDLTESAIQNITFATSEQQQGAMINIDLLANDLQFNKDTVIGGIVGQNGGKISNAYVTGTINAPNIDNVGGAIGKSITTESGTYSRNTTTNEVSYVNASTENKELANVEHIKSNVVITAKDFVGGIVGYDEYGLYKHCWYQILPTTSVGISANQYVGGIVGYSTYSKLQFCSVFSYKYDYASDANYITSLKNQDGSDKQPDIKGSNNVAGLIGYGVETGLNTGSVTVTNATIVRNSSVNARIMSNDKVAAIYTSTKKSALDYVNGLINSSYFVGQLIGDYANVDNLCLDNSGQSATNYVYSLNYNGSSFIQGKTNNFNIENIGSFWNKYEDVNLDYIYVSSDETLNKPIFDSVPSSFDVTVKGGISKTLNTYYYDFSSSVATESELEMLNKEFNQKDLLDLFAFTYAPGGNITVAVRSTDTNVIDVVVGDDGQTKLRIVDLGEAKLIFNPVLNTNLVCEITVKVADNLSKVVVTEDGENQLSQIGIAKGKTKQLQTYSVGEVVASNGVTYTYKSTRQYGLLLELTWKTGSGKISDYVNINIENPLEDTDELLMVYVPYGTPLSITSKEIGGLFDVKVTPCVTEGVVYTGADRTSFVVSTCQGVTGISLNYNSAIVYPNDVTTLVATITTDIELTTIEQIKDLINSIKQDETAIDVYDFEEYITIKINSRDVLTSTQKVEFTIRIDEKFETLTSACKLKINFKSEYSSFETVDYTILPQRIDKIEAKSYVYTNTIATGEIEQTEILKPNKTGLLIIDIAPINGYFDYLEIDDVTGDEEIKFTQLDAKNGSSLFDVDIPSSSGKGIRLAKLDKDNDGIVDSIYVTMQIDKNYSSKLHTIKITAFYQENGVGTAIKTDFKYIDVKMLPIIKVEHQLPNGESVLYQEQSQVPDTIYFANGTSSQFRITTLNTTEPLDYNNVTTSAGVKGKFELVNIHGDFYILKNASYEANDCGGTITITLTAKSIIANNIETTTLALNFTIVKYVIHSVSVTNSNAKGEIYGNLSVQTDLEFYFKATDISYYNNGSYHNTIYSYDSSMTDIDTDSDNAEVVTRKSINNILKELNTNAENYLIKNIGLNNSYSRPSLTTGNETEKYIKTKTIKGETYNVDADTNISLTYENGINLVVYAGYDEDAHLALDMELKLVNDSTLKNYTWDIQPKVENGTIDLSKNYKLNFNKPYSEDDYMLIKNEEDFLAMESGKQNYYILGNDLVLENYSPIDVEIAEFDGNGRTITINSFAMFKEETISAGLFKQIYKDMAVKNVNVVYETKAVETVYSFGKVKTNNNTSKVKDFTIEYADLCNDYTVNYTSATFGGITPLNKGVVTNCTVNGEIAMRASTVEINKTATDDGNYAIAFNVGGLVGTNSETGYITHSTSGLKIFALANIGGLVYDNLGKIASSAVEDEALIYSYNISLEKTILVEVGGFVSQNSGSISMSHTTLNYYYEEADTDNGEPEHYKGFMSTKDESAGFVYYNSGDIKNCYVQISKIGDHSGTYCGFVYSNSSTGNISYSYTSINQGVDAGTSTYMFAQNGTNNLTNCLEFVETENGYEKDSSENLKTFDYSDYILNSSSNVKKVFENYGYIFGSNNSAVWTMENVSLPVLVACEDKVRYTEGKDSNGNNYFGLRNISYVEKTIKNEDGSTSFEMIVEFVGDTYGNKENPFVIYNLSNWENRFYNNTTAYYRIIKDIEFSSLKNPSTSEIVFSGNIQGNDMILNNIKLYIQNDVEALGLFKTMQTADDFRINNSVRNLTLKTTTAWASKADAFGVLSGKAIGFNLYNISIDSDNVVMVGGNAVGGVAGYLAGQFDVDGISSNVSVNSTRELSSYRYSIYQGRNNNVESNLTSVFYAGVVFGVVDGYDNTYYNINDAEGRKLDDKYYYVNNVNVNGNPVVIGDTVGGAFGFVGERTFVKNVNINLAGAEFKGYQYSAGLAGENRGIISNALVYIEGDCFNDANYAAAGVVGLNIGGLVKDVTAQVSIVRDSNISVGGIVARNVNGTINNVSFDGVVMGQITGVIMAANYSKFVFETNTGAGSISEGVNLNQVIPDSHIKYKEKYSSEPFGFENLTISEQTLQYFIDNIHRFYTYQEKTTMVEDVAKKELIQQKSRAFGLFVAMTDIDNTFITNVEYIQAGKIVLNGLTANVEEKVVSIEYKDNKIKARTLTEEKSYWLKSDGSIANTMIRYDSSDYYEYIITEDPDTGEKIKTNTNQWTKVKTIEMNLDCLYTIYITGAKVNAFDSWDKSAYTSDFVVFGNFNPSEDE